MQSEMLMSDFSVRTTSDHFFLGGGGVHLRYNHLKRYAKIIVSKLILG